MKRALKHIQTISTSAFLGLLLWLGCAFLVRGLRPFLLEIYEEKAGSLYVMQPVWWCLPWVLAAASILLWVVNQRIHFAHDYSATLRVAGILLVILAVVFAAFTVLPLNVTLGAR
ncbi:MAG: hypothetical protein M5U15_03685 [Kiritimatiellae bacterium]|nr:hypothetical protein [Kiritimatiellia bacterium]